MKISFYSLLIPALTVALVSCGEQTTNDDTATESNSETVENVEEVLPEEEAAAETVNEDIPDDKWQVDNYAMYLLGEEITPNSEIADNNDGVGWYFTELDLAGGYASVTGAVEGWHEYVIWRMADGDDLVGQMSVGCGPACDYTFRFYKGQGSGIEDYEMSVFMPLDEIEAHKEKMVPKIIAEYPVDYPEDSQLVFNFPQKGTSMQVDVVVGADEIRVPLLKLAWDKSVFSVEEFYEEINIVAG